jgi:hypothetical protein
MLMSSSTCFLLQGSLVTILLHQRKNRWLTVSFTCGPILHAQGKDHHTGFLPFSVSLNPDTVNCSDYIVSAADDHNVTMEHWWNHIDTEKLNYSEKECNTNVIWTIQNSEKGLSPCHFVYQKFHMYCSMYCVWNSIFNINIISDSACEM